MLEIEGTFKNGSVVFDPEPSVPDGTKAVVTVADESTKTGPTVWERMRRLAEECEKLPCDLPEDFARNHDHYIHGTPKRP